LWGSVATKSNISIHATAVTGLAPITP